MPFKTSQNVSGYWHTAIVNRLVHWGKATSDSVRTWMGISMSISVDSNSEETLNRGPLALLLWRQYEFTFGTNILQFSIFDVCTLVLTNSQQDRCRWSHSLGIKPKPQVNHNMVPTANDDNKATFQFSC